MLYAFKCQVVSLCESRIEASGFVNFPTSQPCFMDESAKYHALQGSDLAAWHLKQKVATAVNRHSLEMFQLVRPMTSFVFSQG